jgi:hypothetical protein
LDPTIIQIFLEPFIVNLIYNFNIYVDVDLFLTYSIFTLLFIFYRSIFEPSFHSSTCFTFSRNLFSTSKLLDLNYHSLHVIFSIGDLNFPSLHHEDLGI